MKKRSGRTNPKSPFNFLIPTEFTRTRPQMGIYEGLWDAWEKCGYIFFADDLRKEIERFVYDPTYSRIYTHFSFIRRFVALLNEYSDVDRAFVEAGGLHSCWSFGWIGLKIQQHYNKRGDLPTPADLPFLRTHLAPTDYQRYGYSSWETLIRRNLLHPSPKDRWRFYML